MSRLTAKYKLHAANEAAAQRHQREYEKANLWATRTNYYKNLERTNELYQTWTSPQYYNSNNQLYSEMKQAENKQKNLEERSQKLRQMLFDEEQELVTEITLSPREHREKLSGTNLPSTAVLKEVNLGLKHAENDRRKYEAEIKLYNQWKQNNPIIRDYESNQNQAGLKLAWLDQQIEKQMENERVKEDMKKLMVEREKAVREDEELDRRDREEFTQKEKELMKIIQLQMDEMKLKEREAEYLKEAEKDVLRNKARLENILERRNQELQKRKQDEISLYNINHLKVKLRQKARDVEAQLKADQDLIEELKRSNAAATVANEAKKAEIKRVMDQFLNYVREQRTLENQRQKYIAFIFDSEAKAIWEKQDRLWKTEAETRQKLLQQVLDGLQDQVSEKICRNLEKQQEIVQEREQILHEIEENNSLIKHTKAEAKQKKLQRKNELEKQFRDKQLEERSRELEEEAKRRQELENIKKEEEKIKQEILKIQKREYPLKQKYNRRIIW